MTIDERLERLVERHEALSESVESLTRDIHQMQDNLRTMQEAMIAMDARERRGREAILKSIVAYLQGLDEDANGHS